MNNLKYILSLLFLFSFVAMEAQSKEVNVPFSNPSAQKSLKVNIFSGKITVIGSNRTDIGVTYSVITRADDDDHSVSGKDKKQGLTKIASNTVNLSITEDNNLVKIKTEGWMNTVDLVIEVPKNINLNLSSNLGNLIEVENIAGEINIECGVGDITAKAITGIINASSNAGQINIQFDAITGNKAMMINNTTGEIDITMPSSHSADLKMQTGLGEIYSDLEIVTKASQPTVKTPDEGKPFKLITDQWTYATLNGGGAEMTIRTKMGSIYLRKK